MLYLNGESSGLVNNACFPSTVAASYAPAGQASRSPSPDFCHRNTNRDLMLRFQGLAGVHVLV